jgi:hypothetical protein
MSTETNTVEEWCDIPGLEGFYQVSDRGRVRSLDRHVLYVDGSIRFHAGRMLRPGLASNDYPTVSLRKKTHCIHDVVLAAFIGPRPHASTVARHLDGDKANNTPINLCWGTYKENSDDCDQHGRRPRGSQRALAKLTEAAAREIRRLRYRVSQEELAQRYNVSPSAIQSVHDNRTWTHA